MSTALSLWLKILDPPPSRQAAKVAKVAKVAKGRRGLLVLSYGEISTSEEE